MEATARWVENQVFEELDLYVLDIEDKAPNPPLKGFGGVNDRSEERYATSSLAIYLESRFPGFIGSTFDSESGLRIDEPWWVTFERILEGQYGADFQEVMSEYLATYFYLWDFATDIPEIELWFPKDRSGALLGDFVFAKPGTYSRIQADIPYIGGRMAVVEAPDGEAPGTLVIRGAGTDSDPGVMVFPGTGELIRQSGRPLYRRAGLAGEDDRRGLVMPITPPQVVIEEFGSANSGGKANLAHIVVTNTFSPGGASLGLEVYVLRPPEAISVTSTEEGRMQLTWKTSPLPYGEKPEDNGALRRYRIYRQNTGQEPLAAVDASMTSWEFTHCNLDNDSLTVRAVDKYGNESPDSNSIMVPSAQDCDSEELVPEPPEGGPTAVGPVPLPTPAVKWAVYEASTDFSAMGLFVSDVATVAERKACRLRGGGLCTDTSPTLSDINLRMVLGPFPTREEAIQGFCDNIVPDSGYSVRGFRKAKLLFDGEDHYVFNGPVC